VLNAFVILSKVKVRNQIEDVITGGSAKNYRIVIE
jgi:hypothetical protein